MSNLDTERLINRTRYIFTLLFVGVGIGSKVGGSAPATWGGIFATSGIFLTLAVVNQVFIMQKKVSSVLIYISVTIEISLIFILKFVMHFDPTVGYGMTIKEPATFCVYFLFIIMSALRYNKNLNIYMGIYSIATYTLLLVLAITDGGMRFISDPALFFNKDTIRLASEIPKILFLGAFVFFITKMADYTNSYVQQVEEAEKNSYDNLTQMKKILSTIEETAQDLLSGSNELLNSSANIDKILTEHGALISEVENITKELSGSISDIRSKSSFQFTTVEDNFAKIKEISELMENINSDSSDQKDKADNALKLANMNEQNIRKTIAAITDMKESSKKIEEISQTISEIADKTNLLSLNAAIESARAGEHGKGFAVVADEISKLATMSIDSSKEIATIIQDTVNNIENSSAMIGTLEHNLSRIIMFVKENSGFMTRLNEKTLKELNESKELYTSTVEVDKAAKSVIEQSDRQTVFIEDIVQWFEKMNSLGGEVSKSLRDLQSLSNRLEQRSTAMKDILVKKETDVFPEEN